MRGALRRGVYGRDLTRFALLPDMTRISSPSYTGAPTLIELSSWKIANGCIVL